MTDERLEDLDEIEARMRRNLEAVVHDLISVFRHDIPTFVAREVRNRFVADAEFAERLSDDDIRRIKVRCAEAGEEVAQEVERSLAGDMEFWFGPATPQGEGKTLDAHTPLMGRLQMAAEKTRSLLAEFGFPPASGGSPEVQYTPPAYFVNGKYTPSLAESFWKYLAQLNEVREARREQDEGRRRALQRHRWDTVDIKGDKKK